MTLVKTSTWINKEYYTDLQKILSKYDMSLREFIEYSYLYVRDSDELQNQLLIETRYKKIKQGDQNGKLDQKS
jgi:hypothetical protein